MGVELVVGIIAIRKINQLTKKNGINDYAKNDYLYYLEIRGQDKVANLVTKVFRSRK